MTDEQQEYLWQRRHGIVRHVQISVCYHRKRERFLDFWDRAIKAIAIIGSSVAFADLFREAGGDLVLKVAAAIVALTTTISLVFGLADRARRHSELARAFLELEAQIVGRGEQNFEEADLDLWGSRVRILEAAEPAALNALVVICQAELAIAAGNKPPLVPWYQRLLAHFWSFGPPSTDRDARSGDQRA